MTDEKVYAVIWDCLNPHAVAVFTKEDDAVTFAAEFKAGVDTLFQRMGLSGNERIYVRDSPLNPAIAELRETLRDK